MSKDEELERDMEIPLNEIVKILILRSLLIKLKYNKNAYYSFGFILLCKYTVVCPQLILYCLYDSVSIPVTTPVHRGFVIITKKVPGLQFSEITCTQSKRSVSRRERGEGGRSMADG